MRKNTHAGDLTVNGMSVPPCTCREGARLHWSGKDILRILGRPIADADALVVEYPR